MGLFDDLMPPQDGAISSTSQAQGSGLFDDLLTTPIEGSIPSAPEGSEGFFGGVADFGRGIGHAVVSSGPVMAGQALQRLDPDGGNEFVSDIGKSIETFGEKKDTAIPTLQESMKSREARESSPWNPRGWGYSAGESLVHSVAPIASVAATATAIGASPVVAGGAGLATVGGLFYGATAEDTYRRAKDAGLSEDDAMEVSRITGAIEGGGEMIADVIPLRLFKLLAKPVKNAIVKSVLSKKGMKKTTKEILNTVFAEELTEIAQSGGQTYAEGAYGVRDPDIAEEIKAVMGPTLIVSILFGGGGVAGGAYRRNKVTKALENPDAKPEEKDRAIAMVYTEVKKLDKQLADKFLNRANFLKEKNQPIILSADSEYLQSDTGQKVEKITPSSFDIDLTTGGAIPNETEITATTLPTDLDMMDLTSKVDAVEVSESWNQIINEEGAIPDSADLIQQGADAAALSPNNDLSEPTETQKESGKYKKGPVPREATPLDMRMMVENPAGSKRSGTDEQGSEWSQTMQHHYGYIVGMDGYDKDKLDVFFGPDAATSETVHIIDQYTQTGEFDEHKVVLGAVDEENAHDIYHANYQDGWSGAGAITAMPVDEFKEWGRSGGATKGALVPMERHKADMPENGDLRGEAITKKDAAWSSKDAEIDKRLYSQPVRENLQAFLDSESVVQDGQDRVGKTYIDDDGNVLGKIPSANPEWVQDAISLAGGLDKLKTYVKKAVAGERLGVKAKDGGYSQRSAVSMVVDNYIDRRDDAFDAKELTSRNDQETLPGVDANHYPKEWDEETKTLAEYAEKVAEFIDEDTIIGVLESNRTDSETVKELNQLIEDYKNGRESEKGSEISQEKVGDGTTKTGAVSNEGKNKQEEEQATIKTHVMPEKEVTVQPEADGQEKFFPTPATFGKKAKKGKQSTAKDMHFDDLIEADKQKEMFEETPAVKKRTEKIDQGEPSVKKNEETATDTRGNQVVPEERNGAENQDGDLREEVSAAKSDFDIIAKYIESQGFPVDEMPYSPIDPSWEDYPIVKAIRRAEKETGKKYAKVVEGIKSSKKVVAPTNDQFSINDSLEDLGEITEEMLIDTQLVKESGGRWKYKFSVNSGWFTANSKEDAVERARETYKNAVEGTLLTREQKNKKADNDEFEEMDRLYGKLSLVALEKKWQELGGTIASLRNDREFSGGGRRTAAAVANEGARETGTERRKLGRYIDSRKEQQPDTTLKAVGRFQKKLSLGTVALDEYKTGFAAVIENKEALIAELNEMTKQKIFSVFPDVAWRYKNDNKTEVVNAAYRAILDEFVLGRGISYNPMAGGYDAALEKQVEKTTQEDIDKYVVAIKQNAVEQTERAKQIAEAISKPQTLDDFQTYFRAKMNEGLSLKEARMTLTQKQRAIADTLAATESRENRKERKDEQRNQVAMSGQVVDGEIIETTHTKKGHDLFVVQLAERGDKEDYQTLNSSAKKLGGYYSSYRGGITGFQFRTREDAEAFKRLAGGDSAVAQDAIKAKRTAFDDDKSQSTAERLTTMADALEERAVASLNQQRKTNTHKRAAEASRAESNARYDQAMAETMRRIATGISGGTVTFLDRVRHKTQIEYLATSVRVGKWKEGTDKFDGSGNKNYQKWEEFKLQPPTIETADYAEFPTYTAYRSDLATMGRKLLEVPGTKMVGQRLLKVADDVTKVYTDFAKKNINLVAVFAKKDGSLAAFKTKKDAEWSIQKLGFNGQAIVLPAKRGENLIIVSPSEAVKRGVWEGDGDKRITLSKDFGYELVTKMGKAAKSGKLEIPWQFENTHSKREMLKRMGIETPQEFRAALREYIGMEEQPKEADKVKELERKMVGRKKDGLDFFPTPASIADEMVETSDIREGMSVLEPSAGMGHIADRIRESGVEPDVVEISGERRDILEAKGYNLVGYDFMEVEGEYDRILMNPPFSDRRDAQHVAHAYNMLKPGGRLVAIVGEGVFFGSDKKAAGFREWVEEVGGTDEKLEDGVFQDPSLPVNTGVAARMVVIDKQKGEAPKFSLNESRDLTSSKTPQVTGTTDTQVEEELRSFLGTGFNRLKKTGKLRVMQSLKDLPVSLQKGLATVMWHGTPHSIDKFSTENIGTGEGAQAYGYGLYFAGSKRVAEWYREKLAGHEVSLDGKTFKDSAELGVYLSKNVKLFKGKERDAFEFADVVFLNGKEKTVDGLTSDLTFFKEEIKGSTTAFERAVNKSQINKLNAEINLVQQMQTKGNLYQVELAPKEDEYLLWDKPLSEQSKKVKDSLAEAWLAHPVDHADMVGSQIYQEAIKEQSFRYAEYPDKAASEHLHSLGIRGIKYFDGTSRGAGEGNYNYVIFDDADIEITALYSENGAIAGYYKDGQITLIADNIPKGQAKGVMLHEGLHALLDSDPLFSKKRDKILKQFEELKETSSVIREAYKRVPKDTAKGYETEEAFAYLVESRPKHSLVKSMIAAVKAWLFRHGVAIKNLTEADLVALVTQGVKSFAKRGGKDLSAVGKTALASGGKDSWYYSAVARGVSNVKQKALPAESWLNAIKKQPNIKQEEIEWSGLGEWLAIQKGKVAKKQVLDFLEQGGVQVKEVRKSGGRTQTIKEEAREQLFDSFDWDSWLYDGREEEKEEIWADENHFAWASMPKTKAEYEVEESQDAYENDFDSLEYDDIYTYDEIEEFKGEIEQNYLDDEIERVRETRRFEHGEGEDSPEYQEYTLHGGENYREILLTLPMQTRFESSHWDEPNVLAHIRLNDRTVDDEKVLFVEEIQSDWSLEGRKRGFRSAAEKNLRIKEGSEERGYFAVVDESGAFVTNVSESTYDGPWDEASILAEAQRRIASDPQKTAKGAKIPSAPFVQDSGWQNLAFKRVMRIAAEENYDRIAWVTGEQTSERYSLDKKVSQVFYWDSTVEGDFVPGEGEFGISVYDIEGSAIMEQEIMTAEKLADTLGKEIAERIYDGIGEQADGQAEGVKVIEGDDLKIEAKWARELYDKSVPNWMKKFGKKYKAEVASVDIDGNSQQSIPITDKMRSDVMQGQTLFSAKLSAPSFSAKETQKMGMLRTANIQDGRLTVGGVGATHYDVHQEIKNNSGVKNGTGFVTPDGTYLTRTEAITWVKTEKPEVYGRLDHITKANGLESQAYANAEGVRSDVDDEMNNFIAKQFGVSPHLLFSKRQAVQDTRPRGGVGPAKAAYEKASPLIKNTVDYLRMKFQDKFIPLTRVMEKLETGGWKKTEKNNACQAEELFHGKATKRLEDFYSKTVQPLMDKITAGTVTIDEVEDYLYAKFAPQRNAHIAEINPNMPEGGSGITDLDASKILTRFEHEGKTAELEKIAVDVRKITQMQRDIIRDEGLELDDTMDAWEFGNDLYVPLKSSDKGQKGRGIGTGFNVKRSGTIQALGRQSKADNILSHLFEQVGTTIVRAEKMVVGRTFLKMVEENPNPEMWKVHDRVPTKRAKVNGEVRNVPDINFPQDDNVMTVTREDGSVIYIDIADNDLARVMKNLTPNQFGKVTKTLAIVTRYLSKMNTSLNPEFVVTNFERDIQTAMVHLGGERSAKLAMTVAKNVFPAMKGIRDALRKGSNSEWAQEYERFQKAGAEVSFMDLRGLDEWQEKLKLATKDGIWSKGKEKFLLLGGFIGDYNTAVENAVRLSAFKSARTEGMSDADAASLAKNLTVNFNRKGELGPAMNALYMFANAGVQGSTRVFTALKHKRVLKMMGAVMIMSFGLAELNRLAAGDDDDDMNYWDKVSDFSKQTNLIFKTADGEFKIRLPYGYNVFVAAGYAMSDTLHWSFGDGGKSPTETARFMWSAVMNAFNPLGGDEGLLKILSPTITDPLIEIATNKNFMDSKIMPENLPWGAQKPDSQLYFRNVSKPPKVVTEFLNDVTGGDKWEPGMIDWSPETLDHLFGFAFGGLGRTISRTGNIPLRILSDELQFRDVPFLRHVYQEATSHVDFNLFYDNVNSIDTARQNFREMPAVNRAEYVREHPAYRLHKMANSYKRQLSALRKRRYALLDNGKRKEAQKIDKQMQATAKRFNKIYNKRVQ